MAKKNIRVKLIETVDDLFNVPPKSLWTLRVAKQHSFLGIKYYGCFFDYVSDVSESECFKVYHKLLDKYDCWRKDKIEGWVRIQL